MDFVIEKILSIDKEAETYRQGINELLKQKQKELEKDITDLKTNWLQESKNIKDSIYDNIISKAQKKVEEIEVDKKKVLEDINEKYETNRVSIIEEIFNNIVSRSYINK